MNDEKQPNEYDLVLCGNNPAPIDGVVLGRIEGIKRRLESNNLEIVKTALSDAIAYKEEGLDLVIAALYNYSQEIRQHAVKILREQKTGKAEQALLDYDPRSLFTLFDNWKLKDFALESYLNDPVDTAYKIDLRQFNNFIAELKKIEPQGSKIEALYCPMWSDWYDYDKGESVFYKECLEKIFTLYLPQLEYLELWLGADYDYRIKRYNGEKNDINLLTDLFTGLLLEDSFPNLKYLGLCSCEWANDLVDFLKDTPILKRLRILNLSRGTLTDKGAEILLNCPAINNLHTLDVSMNLLSQKMIDKLSELDCNVIAEPQDIDNYNEGCGRERYCALYE